ncbi:MAG: hypothetical protein LBI70_03465 [Rickettsiales bacterium]|jgi:hypothetical protein|nr:hypothetical protein [Rickettsiales bacterium]
MSKAGEKLENGKFFGLELALIIPLLLVFGCSGTVELNPCPSPIEYSVEFQKNLLEDLDKTNSFYLNQMLIDFYNINQQLRMCDK